MMGAHVAMQLKGGAKRTRHHKLAHELCALIVWHLQVFTPFHDPGTGLGFVRCPTCVVSNPDVFVCV